MINVTKTYLPNKEKYKKYIDEIYENGEIEKEVQDVIISIIVKSRA